jgi:hypothetical protein
MKTYSITFLLLLSALSAYSQNWGIGVRAGDPTGLTVKKYMGGKALEASIGRSYTFYGRGWYDNRFNTWYNDQKFGYESYEYIGYKHSLPISIQVHYLLQKDLSKVADENIPGLDWYLGVGGQLRSQTYNYSYRYKFKGDPNWYYVSDKTVKDIDLGPDAVIGIEYTFDDLPISVFADVTLFMEVLDDPFLFWPQAGVGVRYNLE